MMKTEASVKLPLTCGELVQGTWEGTPCLVSCPIDSYHTTRVRLESRPDWEYPPHCTKTRLAFQAGLKALKREESGGSLTLTTNAPRERGYGTSTADIGASLFALGNALQTPFSPQEVAQIALQIVPSDGTFFKGLVQFDHLQGSFQHLWGNIQPHPLLVIDPGGNVSTLAFNRQDHRKALDKLAPYHRDAFLMLKAGLAENDWDLIGNAATLSAVLHQEILFNPLLETVLGLAHSLHAHGICRAHSGTLLGILLDPEQIHPLEACTYVRKHLPSTTMVRKHYLINGGPQYQTTQVEPKETKWKSILSSRTFQN
jgi:L-threonine kinase